MVRVAENLSATLADADVAEMLGVEPGAPILRIERTAYTFKDRPIEFRIRFVDSTQCSYRNVRGLQD